MAMRWCLWVVVWAWLAAVPAHAQAPAMQRLDEALAAPAPDCAQAVPDAAWRPVALPDPWDRSRPDHAGCVLYRLMLPALADLGPGPLAVWLPAAGMNAELRLNGQRIAGFGPMTDADPRRGVPYRVHTPLHAELPRGLLHAQGTNTLEVLLVSQRVLQAGLAAPWVGPAEAVREAWRAQTLRQPVGALLSSVLTAAIGLYALVLARLARGRREFAWLGAAALAATLRNLGLVVTEPPVPLMVWLQCVQVAGGWFVGLFTVFALRLAQAEAPGLRWPGPTTVTLIGLYLVARTAWTFTVPSEALLWQEWNVQALLPAALALLAAGVLTRLAAHRRQLDLAVLAGAAWLVIGATAHDVQQLNGFVLGETPWRHYAALGLIGAAATLIARRHADALAESQRLAAGLQDEVARQHAALQCSFERLREAERAQARAQERGRLMRELHDGLGLNLVSAMAQARHDERAPAAALTPLLQDCLDDLRLAVDSLDASEHGVVDLLAGLRFRLAPRFEAAGMRLAWQVDDDLPERTPLDGEGALHLLRIVQEALANALKHSGARTVCLAVQRGDTDGALCVEVRDDGAGGGALPYESGGRGMRHMALRAQALGGSVRFERSAPGDAGSVLRLDLPARPAGEARGEPGHAPRTAWAGAPPFGLQEPGADAAGGIFHSLPHRPR